MRLWRRDQELSRERGGIHIIGIDEVGRGCLAGPVVAGAALCPPELAKSLKGVKDSKQLLPQKRLSLYHALRASGVLFAVGWATNEEIDRINIHWATFLAMRRAFDRLVARVTRRDPSFDAKRALVLVDGKHKVRGIENAQQAIVDGDCSSFSIAAASIAAKVARDRWMARFDLRHPGYNLRSNKGYGTLDHRRSLDRLGPSAAHRRSFFPVAQPELFL